MNGSKDDKRYRRIKEKKSDFNKERIGKVIVNKPDLTWRTFDEDKSLD